MKTTTLIISLLATATHTISQTTININFVGLEEIYNNHVGHEWYEEVKVIYAGREYRLRKGMDVDIKVNAIIPILFQEALRSENLGDHYILMS